MEEETIGPVFKMVIAVAVVLSMLAFVLYYLNVTIEGGIFSGFLRSVVKLFQL